MSTNKMREALERAHDLSLDGRHEEARAVLSEALADDDAVRGAMREEFEKWARSQPRHEGVSMRFLALNNAYIDFDLHGAWLAWQASRAAAPQDEAGRHNFELIEHITNWLLARDALLAERTEEVDGPMAPAMNIIDSFVAMGRAAPQSVEPVAWHVCSVNNDGTLSLEFAASWKEAAHEHINDAINEYGIEQAASWVVRPVFAAPPSAPTDAEYVAEGMRLAKRIIFAVTAQCGSPSAKNAAKIEAAEAALRAHLSTRPAQADALDAARYRWLRSLEHCNEAWCFIGAGAAAKNLDAAIDAAMSAPPTKTKEPGA